MHPKSFESNFWGAVHPVPGSGNILMTGVIFLRQVLLAVWPMRRR